ncbi:retropepsin-like domain-containing protein [Pontibacter sp. HSC-14F20]|uniref:retropepsin-like aspartic protease n=1 Tax=Pontibacter sp. HSC-14F20 TaxID=2864136 RepID=UPI001C72F8F3|nr:retropepsin-like aspartic protease [Pontibacter sp. HSC-14F20]MBX0334620.1 retropepsin-like domain-containing protein [Pontibacter sp. HSC-14F20]
MKTLLLSLLLSLALVSGTIAQETIPLKEYFRDLKQVEVTIHGQVYNFLFDTGGGETFIAPEVAKELGYTAYGRGTAYRMKGERFSYQKIDSVAIQVGKVSFPAATVGVWDIMDILPEELPKVDGVLSLKTFQDKVLTIDLAANQMTLETTASLRRQRSRLTPLKSRFATGLDGSELSIFLEVPRQGRSYWFLFDTGNISELLLSHHTAAAWGLQDDTTSQRIALNPIALQLGNRKLVSPAAAESILYDGVLNYGMIRQTRFTIDFKTKEVWMH